MTTRDQMLNPGGWGVGAQLGLEAYAMAQGSQEPQAQSMLSNKTK